ncbi:28108_t:CDS:2 [Dentiscutata erythropus]|uniref:chitin synthase n=1 Tax=Dentiscutata erythropus TaxID=1348616 RepID=A0A9N9I1X6_9GLOM|nr:28108_t:CDS:2 [Dentiscutata erythropus]
MSQQKKSLKKGEASHPQEKVSTSNPPPNLPRNKSTPPSSPMTLTNNSNITEAGQYNYGRRRSSHLVRPERHRPRRTMINDNRRERMAPVREEKIKKIENISLSKKIYKFFKYGEIDGSPFSYWALFARIITFWAPSYLLSKLGGMKQPMVTLCLIIAFVSGILGFLSVGFRNLTCPSEEEKNRIPFSQQVPPNNELKRTLIDNPIIYGKIYDFNKLHDFFFNTLQMNLTNDYKYADLSAIFDNTNGKCDEFNKRHNVTRNCKVKNPFGEDSLYTSTGTCIPVKNLKMKPIATLAFEWDDLKPNNLNNWNPKLFVYSGTVMNLSSYFNDTIDDNNRLNQNSPEYFVNRQFFEVLYTNYTNDKPRSKDISRLVTYSTEMTNVIQCISSRYQAGVISTQTAGCYINTIIMLISVGTVVALTLVRFIMSLLFGLILSRKLTNVSKPGKTANKLLYTVMLVTVYSEDKQGLRTTLDSLVTTDYSDKHKLFFIVVDGMIKGKGNKHYTSDICIGLLDLDPEISNVDPCSYIAIADGEKRFNRAKVYAGHYSRKGHRAPVILVVKIGSEKEAKSPKPGNRGKRDSQMIVMNFFERVYFDERFTELDYELFWKIYYLMGITADSFELLLMVDADTKVAPSSLTYLVSAMKKDPSIMGCCGETRIANKTESWVTGIQVYEYYISHHLGKSFESVFGGVTCLPGCFCMYRLKAPKDGAWVPILSNPDIVSEYQKDVVTTLHEKNLLLLGEDRYLSTLMLRNFPHRKMLFIPQAICHTTVPNTFSVLLSQRRRWINSTVHNLLELVLVSDLCGIACLSMQFVIFLDIIGTVVLPSALVFTFYLIFTSVFNDYIQILPLLLLILILGLPGVLVIITTRKIIYVLWMFVYLLALPIWNFILPLYAYWHFDDFSWGETRKVLGDTRKDEHGDIKGKFDSSKLKIKAFEEWEYEHQCMVKSLKKHQRKLDKKINKKNGKGTYSKSSKHTESTKPLSHDQPPLTHLIL